MGTQAYMDALNMLNGQTNEPNQPLSPSQLLANNANVPFAPKNMIGNQRIGNFGLFDNNYPY